MHFISTERSLAAQLSEISSMLDPGDDTVVRVHALPGSENSFLYEGGELQITYVGKSYIFRAIGNVIGGMREGTEPFPFQKLGIMLDCSRNGVYRVETIRLLLRCMALAGYNLLELYTEDVYRIDGEPYFGYLRGAYSREELTDLDRYAADYGIELVPCIQTLAHLGAIFRWKPYAGIHDVNDILLVDDEGTYALIDKMFATAAACFTSRNINIGMDEAFLLGYGNYRTAHGEVDRVAMMKRHVERVLSIAARYGFRCSMWSDMYYRLAYGGYYDDTKDAMPQNISDSIPADVGLIYWDYYSKDPRHFAKIMRQHKQLTDDVWFAGALWSFLGNLPNNSFSVAGAKASLAACRQENVRKVLFTMWGDNGSECPMCGLLPSLFAVGDLAYGDAEMSFTHRKLQAVCGVPYEAFEAIEAIDKVDNPTGDDLVCPGKYLLYNDCFAGILDTTVGLLDGREYARLSEVLSDYTRGKLRGLFRYAGALAGVLSEKATLGLRTRKMYAERDTAALRTLAETAYTETIARLEAFYDAARELWDEEKKQNGFEVLDYRIGGLIRRVRHCRDLLLAYCDGKIQRIDQLEEELYDYYGNGKEYSHRSGYINEFTKIATVNCF